MCQACATASFDQVKSNGFAERMVGVMNSAALSLMVSVGHRVGLWDAFGGREHTVESLAAAARLSERYVREWLGAVVAGGVVEVSGGKYKLPAEHAAFLTRAAKPNCLAASMQWVGLMGGVEEEVVAAFKHGRGVPYSAYARFDEVMAEESSQTVVAALDEHILPLVDGLQEKLERGIDVLDVGCGRGLAMLSLARKYPKSRFVGQDFLESAVSFARAQAVERGLTNVRFAQVDAAVMGSVGAFDLITTFDAIHDQAKPAAVLANIRKALRPGGVYLCQEIKTEGDHARDGSNPLGTFLYTVSTFHCMSVSLANGGPGLGAAWGRTLCERMIREAGFGEVVRKELRHDMINDYYVCRG